MTAVVAVATCVVLIAAGLVVLSLGDTGEGPAPSIIAQPDPLTDPSQLPDDVTVAVLDGTDDAESASAIAAALGDAGWPVLAEASADESLTETIVYYVGDDLEAAALGIVEAIGVGTIVPVPEPVAGSPITVALGSDALAVAPASTETPASTTAPPSTPPSAPETTAP